MFIVLAKINGIWKHICFESSEDNLLKLLDEILNDHPDNRVHVGFFQLSEVHKIDMLNDLVNKA